MPKIVKDEQVFRAVMQVMMARGYDGATTKRIAAAAGVSEVTLFRKFGSKAELVRQAVEYIAAQADFESVICYSGDVYADLYRIVERYRMLVGTYGDFMAVLIPEMRRHPELQSAMGRPMGVMQGIAALLARYQEEGVLRREHPLQAAAGLLAPLVFFAMARGTSLADQLPVVDVKAHVRLFLEGRWE